VRRPYVIEDGYLRPADGVAEPYNPLEKVDGTSKKWFDASVCKALIDLDPEDSSAIARFASQWGLLGLFTYRMLEWRYFKTITGRIRHRPPSSPHEDIEETVASHSWIATIQHSTPDRRGVVTLRSPTLDRRTPLLTHFGRYMPGVRNRKGPTSFPAVWSDEMWDELCEPVAEFQDYVRVFQMIARELTAEAGPRQDKMVQKLTRRLSNVHPTLEYAPDKPDRFIPGWKFSSLLEACYMAMYLDQTGRRTVRSCKECRTLFTALRPDKVFCYYKCKNRWGMRERRAKERRERLKKDAPNG
jgi:hypothetical protein